MTHIDPNNILKILTIVPIVILFLLSKFFFDYNKDIRKNYKIEINENEKIILREDQLPKMIKLCEKTYDIQSKSDLITIEEILFEMAIDENKKRFIESINKPMARICKLKIFYFNLRDFSFHLGIVFIIMLIITFIISIYATFSIFENLITYFLYSLLSFALLAIYLFIGFLKAKKSFDFESDQISLNLREVI
ncbi:MAG: hypothetical protein PVF58_15625 [Candidatus Methanofastidiosia archaeon]|jgi:hypothetical protein